MCKFHAILLPVIVRRFAPMHPSAFFVWPLLRHSGGLSRDNRRIHCRYLTCHETSSRCINSKGIKSPIGKLTPNRCTVPVTFCSVSPACLPIVISTLPESFATEVSYKGLRPARSAFPFHPFLCHSTRRVRIFFSLLLSFSLGAAHEDISVLAKSARCGSWNPTHQELNKLQF